MKSILYINGSPKGLKNSSSVQVLKDLSAFLNGEGLKNKSDEILNLPVKLENNDDIFKKMNHADYWIISFPLYVDVLPGHMTWWLKEYENYRNKINSNHKITVYGICNSGFPEAVQNREALNILRVFCRKNNLEWRFGIGMGMGGAYYGMKDIPLNSFMKKSIFSAFKLLKNDLLNKSNDSIPDQFVSVRLPASLYRLIATIGWKKEAAKNGLTKKDLFAKPLADS